MKRVLLTGATRVQANDTDRVKLHYASNPMCLYAALRRTGYEIDWRPVVPGEDLSGYDAIISGIAPVLSSWGSKHVYGALWALAQNKPKALLVDDWQVKNIAADLKGVPNRADRLMHPKMPRAGRPEAETMIDMLLVMCDYLGGKTWMEPTLGSFFDWGNRELFVRGTKIGEMIGFDPTVFQPDYGIRPSDQKEKAWVLASLGDHTKWMGKLGLEWPVKTFGRKQWGDKKEFDERLQEPDLMRVYEANWGVLSPKYEHAGSGWWRARFDYARQAGCILLADPSEVEGLGRSYSEVGQYGFDTMSEQSLRDIANEQALAFKKHTWSEDRFVSWARDLVDTLCEMPVVQHFDEAFLKRRSERAKMANGVEDVFE